MEHHLFSDLDPIVIVRPATIDDAPDIARLSTGDITLSEEALDAAIAIIAERLAVASGDDFFTIVAERRDTSSLSGWLSAGGCRGQEHKGWSEIYALATELKSTNTLVDEALLEVALHALTLAQFAGVTTLVDSADDLRVELFEDLGFSVESAHTSDHDQPSSVTRYSLDFISS